MRKKKKYGIQRNVFVVSLKSVIDRAECLGKQFPIEFYWQEAHKTVVQNGKKWYKMETEREIDSLVSDIAEVDSDWMKSVVLPLVYLA